MNTTIDSKNVLNLEMFSFPGFYYSIFSDSEDMALSDEISYYKDNEGKDVIEDDFEVDYKGYRHEICTNYVKNFVTYVNRIFPNLIASVDTDSVTISSPREYNFRTDRCFGNFVFNEGWRERLAEYMMDKKSQLEDRIKHDWTSRDGFWSHTSNDFDEWFDNIKSANEVDTNYVNILLYYALEFEEKYWDLVYETNDDVVRGPVGRLDGFGRVDLPRVRAVRQSRWMET